MTSVVTNSERGNRRRGNQNSQNRSSGRRNSQSDNHMLVYTGPIVLKKSKQEIETHRENFSLTASVTTSAGGVIDISLGSNPNTTASWANSAAIYNEFRVLGMRCDYVPVKASTTYVYGPMATVVDHQNSGTLSSHNVAATHESYMLFAGSDKWSRDIRMTGGPEDNWLSTSSPVATYYIKFYSDLNTASTVLGRYNLIFLVEFRGKK